MTNLRLRQGRRVPEHVFIQLGPEPSDDDTPLVTLPTAELARWLVAAVELAELRNAIVLIEEADAWDSVEHDKAWEAQEAADAAYRQSREAIR